MVAYNTIYSGESFIHYISSQIIFHRSYQMERIHHSLADLSYN